MFSRRHSAAGGLTVRPLIDVPMNEAIRLNVVVHSEAYCVWTALTLPRPATCGIVPPGRARALGRVCGRSRNRNDESDAIPGAAAMSAQDESSALTSSVNSPARA